MRMNFYWREHRLALLFLFQAYSVEHLIPVFRSFIKKYSKSQIDSSDSSYVVLDIYDIGENVYLRLGQNKCPDN